MAEKTTYEELEQRVMSLENKLSTLKLTEGALRESEEKHRSILENIEEGYFEVDLAGNMIFLNDSTAKIIGYSRDELMGMNNRQYTDEKNAEKLYQTFNKVYSTGETHKGFDWQVIGKDGRKRYVEVSASLRMDSEGQPMGFRGIVRDVSERKQSEKKLQESEEKLRTIIEHSNELFYIHNTDRVLAYVSPTSNAIFGYTPEEMMIKWRKLPTDNPINQRGMEKTEKAIMTGKKQTPFLLEVKKRTASYYCLKLMKLRLKIQLEKSCQ